MEKKLLAVTKDRDRLRESTAVAASGDSNSSQALAEKEQQVKELLEEGEKLQKRLLQVRVRALVGSHEAVGVLTAMRVCHPCTLDEWCS